MLVILIQKWMNWDIILDKGIRQNYIMILLGRNILTSPYFDAFYFQHLTENNNVPLSCDDRIKEINTSIENSVHFFNILTAGVIKNVLSRNVALDACSELKFFFHPLFVMGKVS